MRTVDRMVRIAHPTNSLKRLERFERLERLEHPLCQHFFLAPLLDGGFVVA